MKILPLLAAAFAATAALGASPAAAQPASADRTIVVRTADLDLATPAGVAALDTRIRVAVRTVCGTASDVDLHGRNVVLQCRADTLAVARAQREDAIALASRAAPAVLASSD
jgi:UrcA family protein